MFEKIKKDKRNVLFILIIEIFIAIAAIVLSFVFKEIAFVANYSFYIIISYLFLSIVVDVLFIKRIFKYSEKYLDRTDVTISSIFGNEVTPVFEFGKIVILVYNEENEVIWISQTTLLKKEDILGKEINTLIPEFDEAISNEEKQDVVVSINAKKFQMVVNSGLKVVYLRDVSAQVIQEAKYEDERPFIGHIVIDNYQDVLISLGESNFVLFATQVKESIMEWAKKYDLFIRSYSNDSFLIIGEEKNFREIKNDNFTIIDDVRKLSRKDQSKDDQNPLTISIGIGKGNTTSILRTSELAYSALNMALSRGGDQIVINTFGEQFEYIGAKSENKQTRSHIRGRVLSTSLVNLIKNSKNVIIMGHKNMDFDALGASLGVWTICKELKVKAFFVYEDDLVDSQTKKAFRQVFANSQIDEMTVTPAKALQLASDQTLAIVVDVHKPEITLQPAILDVCKEVCVIDHHRKGDSFINNPVFEYHESQSSSASELITELIYYSPSKINIDENVANFLLAGMCLDTKFFTTSTSGKTFEMAMILKNFQANVEKVNEFFKEEYEEVRLLADMICNSKVLSPGIYMAVVEDESYPITRTILAKCAEKILTTNGAKAVFAIGRTDANVISISGRSSSDFNVMVIIESLGGGGHFSAAATQIRDITVKIAAERLEEKVKIYLRDGKL